MHYSKALDAEASDTIDKVEARIQDLMFVMLINGANLILVVSAWLCTCEFGPFQKVHLVRHVIFEGPVHASLTVMRSTPFFAGWFAVQLRLFPMLCLGRALVAEGQRNIQQMVT